jgi:hypothetical protein
LGKGQLGNFVLFNFKISHFKINIIKTVFMKKIIPVCLLCIIIILCSFKTFDHSIVGHWISHDGAPGSKILVDFNSDGTFKVAVDSETENEGKYRFFNDTFYMYDNNCGMQTAGKYKIVFYTEDSASFKLIQDSCAQRIQEVDGGTIVRLREDRQ